MDQSDRFVGLDYSSIFDPNIPSQVLDKYQGCVVESLSIQVVAIEGSMEAS